jgi:hypothetical protein
MSLVASVDQVRITGADSRRLALLRQTSVDHGGNPVEPFIDDEGGWPLRCCLTDSRPGEQLAIVAWSPFEWSGPFAEVGPIVIHATECAGFTGSGVPPQFLTRRQIVRPYGHDRRIAYDHIVLVEPDGSLPVVLADVLARPDVAFTLVRNVLAGCFSFTAHTTSSS